MAYEEYIDNKRQWNRFDRWFQQILLSCFSDKAASAIYGTVVDIIAFFAKIGIFLMLPFKFIQFFIRSWKRQNDTKNRDK